MKISLLHHVRRNLGNRAKPSRHSQVRLERQRALIFVGQNATAVEEQSRRRPSLPSSQPGGLDRMHPSSVSYVAVAVKWAKDDSCID